jgi:class IV lanthipeptide synthase
MAVLWPAPRARLGGSDAPADWSIRALVEEFLASDGGDRWTVRSDHPWLYVEPQDAGTPDQGWKLRVSGTVLSARLILRLALPVLLADRAEFKLAADLDVLEWACSSVCPREMAGKFITIYPRDDVTCGALAGRLDVALAGIEGPAVLSDLPYRPGSLVSCRYGGFRRRHIVGQKGSIRLALRAPDGTLTEDRRHAWFQPPAWAPPVPAGFELPGTTRPAAVRQVLLGDRFAVSGALRFTGRGGIYQAADLKTGETVVVKQARPHMGAARDGLDSRAFLLHEWAMLHLLADTGITPKPVALLQQDGDLFIAEEFLAGIRMDRWALRYQPGPSPAGDRAEFRAVVARLCEVVQEFHSRGLVVRDLSPGNLFVNGSEVRLCDVEYVAFSGTRPRPMGTPGFAGPELRRADMTNPGADLYALGAVLFSLCAGRPPFFAEDDADGRSGTSQCHRARADRLAALLGHTQGSSALLDQMAEVIVALLADDPELRPSAGEAAARLSRKLGPGTGDSGSANERPAAGGRPAARERGLPGTEPALRHASTLIADISGYLAAAWSAGQARPWPFIEYGRPERPLDVYTGVAGVLGVLVRAVEAGYPGLDQVVREAARWLKDRHQPDGAERPGLYLGNCGIAWALGLAAAQENGPGQAGRSELAAEVMSRLRAARTAPGEDNDLLSGTAGTAVGHAGVLQIATAIGLAPVDVSEIRDGLSALAHDLRRRVEAAAPGQPRTNYGFAHGLAGVGYALLAAGSALGDDDLVGHAAKLGEHIMSARIGPADQAWWPDDTAPTWFHAARWCNGSSGIATFLLRLWHETGSRAAFDAAVDAARTAQSAQAGAQTCTCHGLAGDGELFLDLAAATGDPGYVTVAVTTAAQLWELRVRRGDRWLIPDETGEGVGVDFGNGMSGVLGFLLRLCHGGPRLWMADVDGGYPPFRPDLPGIR